MPKGEPKNKQFEGGLMYNKWIPEEQKEFDRIVKKFKGCGVDIRQNEEYFIIKTEGGEHYIQKSTQVSIDKKSSKVKEVKVQIYLTSRGTIDVEKHIERIWRRGL